MRIPLVVLGCVLVMDSSAVAEPLRSPLRFMDQQPVPYARVVERDTSAVAALAGLSENEETLVREFPRADGGASDVKVRRVSILAPGTKVSLGGPDGVRLIDPPAVTLLSGSLVDDPDTRVFLSLSAFGTNGFIIGSEGTEVISGGPTATGAITVYRIDGLPEGIIRWGEHLCGTDALHGITPRGHRVKSGEDGGWGSRGIPCRRADLAIETDWELTRDTFAGNPNASAAYVMTLMAAISEIYTRDINTRLRVNFLRVWEADTDPYSTSGTLNRLFEFQDWWNANMTGTPRNAAHILSGVRGEYGGVAYLPGLCQNEYDYGLSTYLNGSFPYPLLNNVHQNWDLVVTAHELGHNFGAPHTHNVTPPIDGCGLGDCSQAASGTIMSYCHTCGGGLSNINLTLHPRLISENILPYLSGEAPCDTLWSGADFTSGPVDSSGTLCDRGSLTFTATAEGSYTIEWFSLDSQNVATLVVDGINGDGSSYAGSGTNTLVVHNPQSTTPTRFRAEIVAGCGRTTSRVATITYLHQADFNGDGFVDGFDYDDYVTCFEGFVCPPGKTADFNGDGFADGFDYDDFVTAFEAEC